LPLDAETYCISTLSRHDALPISAGTLMRHPDLGDVARSHRRLRGEIDDLDRLVEWLGDEPPRHIPLVTASRREIPRVRIRRRLIDRKSTRLYSSRVKSSYAVFCL